MKPLNNPLVWEESFDDDDNSIWEASGPYGDEEGACIGSWRLVQRLRNNQISWFEDHDPELMDSDTNDVGYPSLSLLKRSIEIIHNDILNSYDQ